MVTEPRTRAEIEADLIRCRAEYATLDDETEREACGLAIDGLLDAWGQAS